MVVAEPVAKTGPVITPAKKESLPQSSSGDKLVSAAAENFPRILDLVGEGISIRKMKAQSEVAIREMEEKRKTLLAEAECYAQKKNADTKSVVDRMNVVRQMMNDFYQNCGNQQLTSEDFSKVITEIVNQMGKVDHA